MSGWMGPSGCLKTTLVVSGQDTEAHTRKDPTYHSPRPGESSQGRVGHRGCRGPRLLSGLPSVPLHLCVRRPWPRTSKLPRTERSSLTVLEARNPKSRHLQHQATLLKAPGRIFPAPGGCQQCRGPWCFAPVSAPSSRGLYCPCVCASLCDILPVCVCPH